MEEVIFKYYPNAINEVFLKRKDGKAVICECCGKETIPYLDRMYSIKNVEQLCPACVASGEAAKKFDGDYVQDAQLDQVSDSAKQDALFHRTPGYLSWQGEYWLACCEDFCAFIKHVGVEELEAMGIADEVIEEYERMGYGYTNIRKFLSKDGNLCGYLFQCLHCGKYHIWVDAD